GSLARREPGCSPRAGRCSLLAIITASPDCFPFICRKPERACPETRLSITSLRTNRRINSFSGRATKPETGKTRSTFERRKDLNLRLSAFRKSLRASPIWGYTRSSIVIASSIPSSSSNVAASADAENAVTQMIFPVRDYDLAATLTSGQAFRWQTRDGAWEGVVGMRWVRLRAGEDLIIAETADPVSDWSWLATYLQVNIDLSGVVATFPDDEPMRAAVAACRGLRLLRQ